MKKINPILISLLLLCLGCSGNVEEKIKYGEIFGVVYDKNVGDPIPVAQVQLSPGGKSTVTGSDGSFSFKSIEAGKYSVSVTKKGYNDGNNNVDVVSGEKVECNLLMERIPAYVTSDKTELDFGDNATLTTLSFNIVNSSYENLSWHIDYDKSSSSFIAEVSPESGTTQYGKSAVIVVKIDRDKLNAGANESTIVVVSENGDGSSEVKVKAIGQEKVKASLNINGITEITSSTAIVDGEITFVGVPEYTERGFVYSTSENPTIYVNTEKVTVSKTDEAQFSYKLKNLSLNVKYYVRAFAISPLGEAYSSNQESFTTIATIPVVSISSPDHFDATKKMATLHGSIDFIGDPSYFEKGFVYCEGRKTPTIDDEYVKVSGTGIGTYDVSISELKLGSTYCARSYAKNEGGIAYSDKTVEFTLNGTAPIVNVGETTNINLSERSAILHGNLESLGSPAATEKGFVYSSVNKIPTENDMRIKVDGIEVGSYYASITELEVNKTYYVRSYAKSEAGIAYSAIVTSFTTNPKAPSITMLSVSDINLGEKTAVFRGSVDSFGDPAFYEKGFVYSFTNSNPTLSDFSIKVTGNSVGTYESTATDLTLEKQYYIRAYVINAAGTTYSQNTLEFSTITSPTSVTMKSVTEVDLDNMTAIFQGSIEDPGDPSYTEKGFVYSTTNSTPTLSDLSIIVSGSGSGFYKTTVHNLDLNKTYYTRAYAINPNGVSFSTNILEFSTNAKLASVTMKSVTDVNRDKLTALFQGYVDSSGEPQYTEKGFVYSTSNILPTIDDTRLKVSSSGLGYYEANATGLSLAKYYVRAYIINKAGISYSDNVLSFEIDGTTPKVQMYSVTNINLSTLSIVFTGYVEDVGFPKISERGFVFNDNNAYATINDNVVIATGDISNGYYSATAYNLLLDRTYYVRAYVKNATGYYYSEGGALSFNTIATLPQVSINPPSNLNTVDLSISVSGSINSYGNPPFTEKGFVFGFNNYPTVEKDSVLIIDGTQLGSFSGVITNLVLGKKYYIRAFAKNAKGISYSSEVSFNCEETLPVCKLPPKSEQFCQRKLNS